MSGGLKTLRVGVGALCLAFAAGAVRAELILDDGQPGTSSAGLWLPSTGRGPHGGRSLYAKAAGAAYTFSVPVEQAGAYAVSLWWTSYASRYWNVRVDVEHSEGSASLYVDQRHDGSKWNTLGAFNFAGEARITVRCAGVGSTCADAVRLVPVAAPYFEKIMDNGRAGTSRTGSWARSSGLLPYGPTSWYAKQAGATFTYRFDVPEPGDYELSLWWTTLSNRSSAVPVSVSGAPAAVLDQKVGGGTWNSIGTFAVSSTLTVTILSPGGGTTCADAAKIVRKYAEPGPTSEPIAHWTFDEGEGSVAHDVAGGHDGNIFGAAWEAGRSGKALRFDGVDDYVAVPGTFSFEALTFAAWVKANPGVINNNRIITLHDGIDPNYYHFDVETNSGRGIQVYYGSGSVTVNDYDRPLRADSWIHVAVTYDGNAGRIFRDGQLIEEGPLPVESRSGQILIGGVDKTNSNAQAWAGAIDDVVVYNRALTPEEVGRLYSPDQPPPLPLPDPIAYWSFDEGAGSVAHDPAGGYDGDIFGASWEAGRYGQALHFDGIDDYAMVPETFVFGPGTFAAWVKPDAGDINNNRVVTIDDGIDPKYYYFDVETCSSGGPGVNYSFDGTNSLNDCNARLPAGQWTHIAATFDGVMGRLYVEGQLVAERPLSGSPRSGTLFIGGLDEPTYLAQPWAGSIDEVVFFNRALTPEEVHTLYMDGVQ